MNRIILILLFIFSCSVVFSQTKDELLYNSVVNNDIKSVQKLLKENANPNFIYKKGWMSVNPLITAVNNENLEIVKILINNNADVNWKDGFNTSALMYAAAKGNLEITQFLIEKGADVFAEDGTGNNVLSAAKESGNKAVISLIENSRINKDLTVDELINKGDEYCQVMEDFSTGISYYNKALAKDPNNPIIHKKRAGAYFALKDFEKAISDFTFVIEQNPQDIADMYFMRGLCKSLLEPEDVKGACADFKTAKQFGYDTRDLKGLNEYCGTNDLEN